MDRRTFLASIAALASARSLFGAARAPGRLGLASFSCALHWRAVAEKKPGTAFSDAESFYDYARKIGADGVQTGLRGGDPRRLRDHIEKTEGYYEAELGVPRTEADVEKFDRDVALAREAGATVARAVLLGGRRYETFKTADELREFRARGQRSLELAEPVLKKHGLHLAVENHKDQTAPEFVEMLRKIGSEWVGVCVDTGNNLALLEEPMETVKALLPFAWSVHLKDMAVEPTEEGFLLSEVPLGTGFLDLPAIIAALRAARPGITFNLEMATRDPLKVPCLTPAYFATFPGRPATELAEAMTRVRRHPPKAPLPRITGKSPAEQLAFEEENNRKCLAFGRKELGF